MTTPTKPEVDGQVHWHPKYGWYWPKLTTDNYANLKSYGYEIKPVCLISPEEKAQFERLKAIAEWVDELVNYRFRGLTTTQAIADEYDAILAEGEESK